MQAAQQERERSFCLGLRPASGLQGSTQTAPKSVKTVVFCAWEHTAQEKDFLLRRSYSLSCKDQGPQLHVTEKSNSVVQFLFVLLQDNGGGAETHPQNITQKNNYNCIFLFHDLPCFFSRLQVRTPNSSITSQSRQKMGARNYVNSWSSWKVLTCHPS